MNFKEVAKSYVMKALVQRDGDGFNEDFVPREKLGSYFKCRAFRTPLQHRGRPRDKRIARTTVP